MMRMMEIKKEQNHEFGEYSLGLFDWEQTLHQDLKWKEEISNLDFEESIEFFLWDLNRRFENFDEMMGHHLRLIKEIMNTKQSQDEKKKLFFNLVTIIKRESVNVESRWESDLTKDLLESEIGNISSESKNSWERAVSEYLAFKSKVESYSEKIEIAKKDKDAFTVIENAYKISEITKILDDALLVCGNFSYMDIISYTMDRFSKIDSNDKVNYVELNEFFVNILEDETRHLEDKTVAVCNLIEKATSLSIKIEQKQQIQKIKRILEKMTIQKDRVLYEKSGYSFR